jgi:hypothetical protein
MSSSYWPAKRRRQRHADWDQIHRLATVGGRSLRELSNEFHIPYGTLLNRSYRERWMVARLKSSRSAARGRNQTSQQLAAINTTGNQRSDPGPNGVRTQAILPPPQPALSSDLPELLQRVTPDNAASFILAAINVLGKEARTYTGRALAYGLSHDDFLALSRAVSALSANRTAFGYRAPSSDPRYNPNCY